jgi:hypothetical protein
MEKQEKNAWTSTQDYIKTDDLGQAKEEVFFGGIWLLIFFIYFCFNF